MTQLTDLMKINPLNRFLKRLEERLLTTLNDNPSADAPYHNNFHMKATWLLAKDVWDKEQEDVGLGDPTWGYVVLMFASLFHDWDHSAGKDSDHYNVLRAREFVEELIDRYGFTLPEIVIKAIDDAIAVTEYPFVMHPKNKLEAVLRDADSLYATFMGNPATIMDDLRAEMQVKFGNALTYQQMLDGQTEFMAKTSMFTKTAQAYWDEKAPIYLKALKEYAKERGTQSV